MTARSGVDIMSTTVSSASSQPSVGWPVAMALRIEDVGGTVNGTMIKDEGESVVFFLSLVGMECVMRMRA